MARVFNKEDVADWNKLYSQALSKFKVKEDFIDLSVQRRLPFLMRYLQTHRHSDFNSEYSLVNQMTNRE